MGWGLTDLKEIAAKVAGLPKENGARGRVAVCTQGPDPTIIATGGTVTTYPIIAIAPEAIVDTNGAGDAYVGGFIAALTVGKSTEDCTKAGAYAANVVIGRSGCTYPEKPDHAL
jgi:adenosine kinase